VVKLNGQWWVHESQRVIPESVTLIARGDDNDDEEEEAADDDEAELDRDEGPSSICDSGAAGHMSIV